MTSFYQRKKKINKEILVVLISSIASLLVALILGYSNLKSTEKQITNQISLKESEIKNEKKLAEDREERELRHLNILHNNSLDLLNKQRLEDLNLFNEKKLREKQEETKKAANYIASEILVRIIELESICSITPDKTLPINNEAFVFSEALSDRIKLINNLLILNELNFRVIAAPSHDQSGLADCILDVETAINYAALS